jgi:nucleoside-diphosphate-sugar epimerase
LTKLAGEALCLADPRSTTRIVRLSNVYGIDMPVATFLGGVLHQGQLSGKVLFHESSTSARDYVSVAAVARLLPAITSNGRHRLYNVAAGTNIDHASIARRLNDIAGWQTSFVFNAPTVCQPPIDTTRADTEFGHTGSDLLAELPALLALGQEAQCSPLMRHMAA